MSQPIDMRPEHLSIVQKILRDVLPRDAKVWVFGSRAKWTTKKSSDLDIAIDAGRTLTRKEESLLTDLFEESDLPYKVDVIDINAVSESFKRIIETDKVNLEVFLENEWKIYFLEETGRIVTGKTPSTAEKENFGGNTPFITPSDMNENKFISTTERCLTEIGLEKVKSSILPNNSVLVSCIGTVGNVAINMFPSVTNQQLNSIVVNENFDADFIYYSLKTRKSEIQALASSGSVQPIINKRHFSRLTLMAPPLPEQRAIAAILGALDDKIEANRRMNATLEGIARALFKSWFVDFDPVHAKAEGRPSGLPADLDALFPASFTDSPLGEIPMGWEVKSLGDILQPKKGKSITKKTIVEGNIPVVAGGLEPAYFHNQSNSKAPTITVSASGANAGFVRLYNIDIWASDCSTINKSITTFVYSIYVFLKINQKEIYDMQQGAAQPHIYPSDIMRLGIVNPSLEIWEALEKIISPLFEKLGRNDLQNQTLATLRDTLLPKLISGQIRVKDAEKMVEAAV